MEQPARKRDYVRKKVRISTRYTCIKDKPNPNLKLFQKQHENWEAILRKEIKMLNEKLQTKYNWDKAFCELEYGNKNRLDAKKNKFIKLKDLDDNNTDPNNVVHLFQSVQDETHESRR